MCVRKKEVLELIMIIIFLSVEVHPFEVTEGELLAETICKVFILVFVFIHLDLDVSVLVVEAGVELILHLRVHLILQVQVDVLGPLHPGLLGEGDVAGLEEHHVAFLAESMLVPLAFLL
jgi:hypothetical protein